MLTHIVFIFRLVIVLLYMEIHAILVAIFVRYAIIRNRFFSSNNSLAIETYFNVYAGAYKRSTQMHITIYTLYLLPQPQT